MFKAAAWLIFAVVLGLVIAFSVKLMVSIAAQGILHAAGL